MVYLSMMVSGAAHRNFTILFHNIIGTVETRVVLPPGMWEEVLSAGEMLGLSRSELNAIVE